MASATPSSLDEVVELLLSRELEKHLYVKIGTAVNKKKGGGIREDVFGRLEGDKLKLWFGERSGRKTEAGKLACSLDVITPLPHHNQLFKDWDSVNLKTKVFRSAVKLYVDRLWPVRLLHHPISLKEKIEEIRMREVVEELRPTRSNTLGANSDRNPATENQAAIQERLNSETSASESLQPINNATTPERAQQSEVEEHPEPNPVSSHPQEVHEDDQVQPIEKVSALESVSSHEKEDPAPHTHEPAKIDENPHSRDYDEVEPPLKKQKIATGCVVEVKDALPYLSGDKNVLTIGGLQFLRGSQAVFKGAWVYMMNDGNAVEMDDDQSVLEAKVVHKLVDQLRKNGELVSYKYLFPSMEGRWIQSSQTLRVEGDDFLLEHVYWKAI